MIKTKAEKNKACHSRGMLSGIYNACRCKIGKDALLNGYVEDPRLDPALRPCGTGSSGMTAYFTTARGFTLIELLVVVLIIGILAAVAVPQYQKAVAKARFAALKPVAKAVKDAQEIYYNEHGVYGDFEDLDIDFPEDADLELSNTDGHEYVRASGPNLNNRYTLYFNHSDNFAGNVYCEAEQNNALANALCVAEHGQDAQLTQSGYKLYLMAGSSTGELGQAPFELIQGGNANSFAYSDGNQTFAFDYLGGGSWVVKEYDSNANLVGSTRIMQNEICSQYPFVDASMCY